MYCNILQQWTVLRWSSGHWVGFISALHQNHSYMYTYLSKIAKPIFTNSRNVFVDIARCICKKSKCICSVVKQWPVGRFYLRSASKSFIRGRSAATHLGFEGIKFHHLNKSCILERIKPILQIESYRYCDIRLRMIDLNKKEKSD